MARLQRPGGFKAGIAIGTAIALLGFLFGVAVASIPSSTGVISACYSTTTGSLRVIDSPSKHCVSGERSLSWNKNAPAPATPPVVDLACTPVPGVTGSITTSVEPVTGLVTLRCSLTLKISSTIVLSQVSIQGNAVGDAPRTCSNTKVCSVAFSPETTQAEVLMYATVAFHYTCPGASVAASFFDTAHALNVGRCQSVFMTSNRTVLVTT